MENLTQNPEFRKLWTFLNIFDTLVIFITQQQALFLWIQRHLRKKKNILKFLIFWKKFEKKFFFFQNFHFSSPHSSASRCVRSTMRVWKMFSVLRGIQKNAKRVIMMARTYQNFDFKLMKNRKISIFLKFFFQANSHF